MSSRKNVEWPSFTELHWYAAALALVIIGVVLFGFGSAWIILAPSVEEMKDRTQVITPFATVFLALITFCTVAWRGMVTSRQADQQLRQNDAKDEENLAKLLMDGTKLVSEERLNRAQTLAGIAALQAVIVAPLDRFSIQAMDILIDVAERTVKIEDETFVFQASCRALGKGAEMGRYSDRILKLESLASDQVKWIPVKGARLVRYMNGVFKSDNFNEVDLIRSRFVEVTFESCNIVGGTNYYRCDFESCSFDKITQNMLTLTSFKNCDFSNTKFDFRPTSKNIERVSDMRENGCFFRQGHAPTGDDSNWALLIPNRIDIENYDENKRDFV